MESVVHCVRAGRAPCASLARRSRRAPRAAARPVKSNSVVKVAIYDHNRYKQNSAASFLGLARIPMHRMPTAQSRFVLEPGDGRADRTGRIRGMILVRGELLYTSGSASDGLPAAGRFCEDDNDGEADLMSREQLVMQAVDPREVRAPRKGRVHQPTRMATMGPADDFDEAPPQPPPRAASSPAGVVPQVSGDRRGPRSPKGRSRGRPNNRGSADVRHESMDAAAEPELPVFPTQPVARRAAPAPTQPEQAWRSAEHSDGDSDEDLPVGGGRAGSSASPTLPGYDLDAEDAPPPPVPRAAASRIPSTQPAMPLMMPMPSSVLSSGKPDRDAVLASSGGKRRAQKPPRADWSDRLAAFENL